MDTIERDPELENALRVVKRAGLLAVAPRLSPTERAEEAIEQMAHVLISLQDALRAGASLSEQKRKNLIGFVSMLNRLGAQ